MRNIIDSIRGEYLRYKSLAEAAIDQLSDSDLSTDGPNGGNSIAVMCWHVAGNLQSRFTQFLTTDGEKPWRQRDDEFVTRGYSHADVERLWAEGWQVLEHTLSELSEADLGRTVMIRGESLSVHAALCRALAHVSYHTGQIVLLARMVGADEWKSLSIPKAR